MIPVCSVVTKKTLTEFKLLKFSIEQYHDVKWYLSCDTVVEEYYKETDNITLLSLIETDDCDHNVQSQEKLANWMKVMMTKFDVCNRALQENTYCLFLDSDMVFVNPIEEEVLNLISSKKVQAAICPHMTNNAHIEAKHGYYNAGMFFVNSLDFIKSWENLSKDYKKYNLYFEQQPLEFIHRDFLTANLPINYNLGWWRFNLPQTQGRISMFNERDDILYFGNRPAINFHFHCLRELETDNYGQFLVDFVFKYLKESKNIKYKDLYDTYHALKME